ncbi:MAG: PH domain-containing protein [Candidatus Levyibacteriota bacterium]
MVNIYSRIKKNYRDDATSENEKKFRTQRIGKKTEIIISHTTIRQSISILLLKLVFLEVISAIIFILFQPVLFSPQLSSSFPYINFHSIELFVIAAFLKILVTIYIVLSWLNEYYEITPNSVRHHSGIIFLKREQFSLNDIQSVILEQSLAGRLLNFGTLRLFDWKWRKHQNLYAIHNPIKYLEIIESLLPGVDQEESIIR